MSSGLKLASLYGIFPHQLGFCGSQKKSTIQQIYPVRKFRQLDRLRCNINSLSNGVYDFLLGKNISQRKIREILEGFKGAFFYYKLIARSNEIRDPFDEKVVKAYWIGNNLLEEVKTEDLRKMIAKDFSGPGLLSKKIAEKKARGIPAGLKPHHSFHVLVIGSVTGRIKLKGKLLDLCRVGWGRVIKESIIKNKEVRVLVRHQPLVGSKILKLGKPVKKEIFWDKNLIPEIKIGDWVSFHWDNVVQVLKIEEVNSLNNYTNLTLKLLENSLK